MKNLFSIIFILLLATAYSNANRTVLLEKYNVDIGNGKSIWLKVEFVDNYTKCYELSMGGAYHGTATNCHDDINYAWAYSACGSSTRSVNGGVDTVVNKILQECTN